MPKEWYDYFQQFFPRSHDETIQVFFVIVITLVGVNMANPKEIAEFVQARDTLRPLRDGKLVTHLIAGFVAFTARPTGLSDEADGEAPFSVHKPNDLTKLNQSFLLIVRTQHIVTTFRFSSVGYTGFPAYGRMLTSPLLTSRATKCYLRTVIVTAAVYRSFGCELHGVTPANPLP